MVFLEIHMFLQLKSDFSSKLSPFFYHGGSGLSPCQPLLQAVRQRLQARLEGVLEAVARGRRESAMMLRVPGMDWAGIGGLPVGAQMMG